MRQILLTLSFFAFIIVAKAQVPQLWSTCEYGGALGYGAIIKADNTGYNFHVVYSFDSINGSLPKGNLCDGGNGKLYGVTYLGGYEDSCVCFCYDTLTGDYTNFYDFFINPTLGVGAESGMILAADGMLYGLTAHGGFENNGVIYRVNPFDNSYSFLYSFSSQTGYGPVGDLVQLNDGKLYGVTPNGGYYNSGVIFSFDPVFNIYNTLYEFNMTNGCCPIYERLLKANDGTLYGLAAGGGIDNDGVIFNYDPDSNIYSQLYDFHDLDGAWPFGSLIQADDGLFYGMTYKGGLNDSGVIFSYNVNTQVYSLLYSFDGQNGSHPQRSLTQGSNGKLFGTTSLGGLNNAGTAFSFDITNNTFTKLMDFAIIGCSGSSCDILETGGEVASSIIPVQKTKQVTTYPNPAIDYITVLGKILTPKTHFELCDVQDKRILNFTLKGNTLNVSHLPPGFYVLKITEGNTVAVGKFMKE